MLPGPELEVKPLEDRRAPVVVRIADAYPHGSAFRYDLVYYGLEPGEYDLQGLPAAQGRLPTGRPAADPGQGRSACCRRARSSRIALALEPSPSLGGYRLLLAFGGSLWCAGLAAILLLGRRKQVEAEAAGEPPGHAGRRLRPLVDAAVAGKLSAGPARRARAAPDRLLAEAARARAGQPGRGRSPRCASIPEAGPLLRQLEDWLHSPARRAEPVDVAGPARAPTRICRPTSLDERGRPRTPSLERRSSRPPEARTMSFAYPLVLLLLVVPLLLLGWVWRRTGGRVALPFDHGGQARAGSGPAS